MPTAIVLPTAITFHRTAFVFIMETNAVMPTGSDFAVAEGSGQSPHDTAVWSTISTYPYIYSLAAAVSAVKADRALILRAPTMRW